MKLRDIGKAVNDIQSGGTVLVITDSNVAPLYLQSCLQSIESAGISADQYILDAGEASKNGENFLRILEYMASIPLTRSDGVVALGGGMVGDIAGFTAACYMRGIHVYQVPTTLLAAVDSSVGGKTAIDLAAGKNLAGAFHQPAMVLQDSALLESLPEDVYREGMAEVIKYAMIEDESMFRQLQDPVWIRVNIAEIIERCVSIKRRYVEADEFDMGLRHMLNFGHTIGHAIEILSGCQLSHGDSVAKGMYWMTRIAEEQGWCEVGTLEQLKVLLHCYGFDLTLPEDKEAIYDAICKDKKRLNDTIELVVPERIGRTVIRPMKIDELRGLL